MVDDHITREQFLLEFYGNFDRELGNPPFPNRKRYFSENPNDIFECIEFAKSNKLPAFISVNPREEFGKVSGIEKLFFDFDYADKTFMKALEDKIKDPIKREAVLEKRKVGMQKEVEFFLNKLAARRIVPLVVKTRKGFHVYIYLDKVYSVTGNNEEILKETYYQLQRMFMLDKKGGYKYLDDAVVGDFKRMCRIPTSTHEVSGEECYLVDRIIGNKVEKAKFRGLEAFKLSGLKDSDWIRAVGLAYDAIKKRELASIEERERSNENWEMENGFIGEIRSCFKRRMEAGEMCHQMRLALLLEAYWAGYNTKEKMRGLFRCFHDYDGDSVGQSKCRDQIEWFWKNKVPDIEKTKKWKPYRCTTIEDLNLCDKMQCSLYKKRKEKNEQKR
jgi:hypothetical protein